MNTHSLMNRQPFKLNLSLRDPLLRKAFHLTQGLMERVFYLNRLNKIYGQIAASCSESGSFLEQALEEMEVRYTLDHRDLRNIPAQGPCLVVANHPFGAVEGLVLAALLKTVRPDIRIMANHLLAPIHELKDVFIFVNPFGGEKAAAGNILPMRACCRWLRSGGVLAVFPAGAVSHLQWKRRGIRDPEWSPSLARLIRLTRPTLVPVFFEGANSPLFQIAGLIHPKVRTALLPREFCNKRGRVIHVRTGRPTPCARLDRLKNDDDLMRYLRLRTYLLAQRGTDIRRAGGRRHLLTGQNRSPEPLATALPRNAIEQDVQNLPPTQCLLAHGNLQVYYARARQIPFLLHEIGRLREQTFRLTHEGTGHPLDLDRFDRRYLHLFVWDARAATLAGAYRMGPTDRLFREQGLHGLYTHSLFRFRPSLLRALNPALELGRSFVPPDYQKDFAPLMLLWKGIGAYVARYPRYRNLFGPVSINRDYHALSRWMMMRFLEENHLECALSREVRPRRRPPLVRPDGETIHFTRVVDSLDDLSELIEEIEFDGKGVPILLKHYLKLGGSVLAFNIDPGFNQVLDGLVRVDLLNVSPRLLEKYMGTEGARRFRTYHDENALSAERNHPASDETACPPGLPAPAY